VNPSQKALLATGVQTLPALCFLSRSQKPRCLRWLFTVWGHLVISNTTNTVISSLYIKKTYYVRVSYILYLFLISFCVWQNTFISLKKHNCITIKSKSFHTLYKHILINLTVKSYIKSNIWRRQLIQLNTFRAITVNRSYNGLEMVSAYSVSSYTRLQWCSLTKHVHKSVVN